MLPASTIESIPFDTPVEVINRGKSFTVTYKQLAPWPYSRVTTDAMKAATAYEPARLEYNRNHTVFESIMDFYSTGRLHVLRTLCWRQFQEEMLFWNLDVDLLSQCCSEFFKEDRKKERTTQMLREYWFKGDTHPGAYHSLWRFFEDPDSSTAALVSIPVNMPELGRF